MGKLYKAHLEIYNTDNRITVLIPEVIKWFRKDDTDFIKPSKRGKKLGGWGRKQNQSWSQVLI